MKSLFALQNSSFPFKVLIGDFMIIKHPEAQQ